MATVQCNALQLHIFGKRIHVCFAVSLGLDRANLNAKKSVCSIRNARFVWSYILCGWYSSRG